MIPIVFSTDHNYVMPAAVTICSLLESAQNECYDIYILSGESVTNDDKELLARQVKTKSPNSNISFIDMGNYFKDGFEIRGISRACYYRLMIPWILPHLDKVVYSDVDVIFKCPLKPLFDTDIEGKFVAGALTIKENRWKEMEKYFSKIGADYKEYINSGMLVINSRLQREFELDKVYREYSSRKYLYQDQDIINIVCKGKIAHFNWRYNLNPESFGTSKELVDDVIIHYAGGKPWNEFTFAWVEWWRVFMLSVCADAKFYHEISAKILNKKYQLKLMLKKSRQKLDVMARKLIPQKLK